MTQRPDPLVPGIQTSGGNKHHANHNHGLSVVLAALHQSGITVNYDHITTTIPKDRLIPLMVGTPGDAKRADIAFRLSRDITVHVWITLSHRPKEGNGKAVYSSQSIQELIPK